MLMGFATVDKDGKFALKGDIRALYAVMMTVRIILIVDCN